MIAHRGASGYLPEHTLAAKALAYGLGADFLEQDIVATRDDKLIVLHDIHLDTVSDVAERFPGRARDDGRWYARDFDLAEIRTLRAFERVEPDRLGAVFPDRFPIRTGYFSIPTLEDLQCFDPEETRRLRAELDTELRIVQLIADNAWGESSADYDHLLSAEGLAGVAGYADAIGPWMNQLYRVGAGGQPESTGVVEAAHDAGLAVHPYTFRADALPPGFSDYPSMVRWFRDALAVDGLFTDFTDLTLRALGR